MAVATEVPAPPTDHGLPTAGATAPRLRHMPGLDGLRGLAVIAVLLFHGGFSWAVGGYLGVSAFFTLSGFLITSLLLLERDASGRIAFGRFWSRRFRRLLPAAMVALALVVAFGALAATSDQVRALRGDVFGAIGYSANWRFMLNGRSYLALFTEPSPVQHFWSLSIEEQFYLVFPLLAAGLLALGAGSRRTFGLVLAGLAVASTGLMAVLSSPGADTSRAYYGTDTRMAELLAGALLAVVLTPRVRERPLRLSRRAVAALDVVGVIGLVGMAAMWWRVEQARPWLYEGGFAIHALMAVAVIASVWAGGRVSTLLSVRPLREIGRISYGLYLFHWPVYLWLTPERTGLEGWSLFVLRVSVSALLAVASYHFVEMPVRSGRRLTHWRPAVIAPATAVLLVVAVVAVTLHPAPPSVVLEPVSKGPPPAVHSRTSRESSDGRASDRGTGRGATAAPDAAAVRAAFTPRFHRPLDSDRPLRMLVVGDSVAVSLGRGLERWGLDSGRASVWNAARYWCSIGRSALRATMGDQHSGEACDGWEPLWTEHVQRFDPDSALVLSTIWEVIDRKKDGWDDYHGLGEPIYDDWLMSEYERAVDVLSAQGATVMWVTIPCLEGADAATAARIRDYNTRFLPLLAKRRPQVKVVDIFSKVCPDGDFAKSLAGVDDFRPDGTHFSDAGADWVASWLMPYALT